MYETPLPSPSLASSSTTPVGETCEIQESISNPSVDSTPVPSTQGTQLSTGETKEGKPIKPRGYNMCYIITFVLCLYIQFTAFARLLRDVEESPKVGGKWAARDVKLPFVIEPPLQHIDDGDILKLDNIISSNAITVTVFYAPWSRVSYRVIENFSELAGAWQGRGVGFLAVNCWLYLSLCRENMNQWEYPQVMVYHKNLNYEPFSYQFPTFPATFSAFIEKLVDPVIVVKTFHELNEISVRHHRCVIGIFSDYRNNRDYLEFRKAAILHHFEQIDVNYVPFIVLDTNYSKILETEKRSYLIFKYVLFETLSLFEGRQERLKHYELLDWLKPTEKLIRRLKYSHFGSLTNHSKSVILASPLHRNTDNYVTFMRNIQSYRHCRAEPQLKVHCKLNRTCLNPCRPDQTFTTDSFLPCFLPERFGNDIVKHCFFNTPKQRSHAIPNDRHTFSVVTEKDQKAEHISNNLTPHKLSPDTLLTHQTFVDNAVMCSKSKVGRCVQCGHLDKIQEELEESIKRAAGQFRTIYHGLGCGLKNNVFYALDSANWADMVEQFGVNDTDRAHTEALVKVDNTGERLYSHDLTNRTLHDPKKFYGFVWGPDGESEEHLQNPSGTNEKRKENHSKTDIVQNENKRQTVDESNGSMSETMADINKDFAVKKTEDSDIFISSQQINLIKEISRLDLISLQGDPSTDYLVFVYTKWCGFCHVVQRRLEVVHRLSESPVLSFVKVDSDINNQLKGSKFSAKRVPVIYLLRRGSPWPLLMKPGPQPASVKDIINFVVKHAPASQFTDSYGSTRTSVEPSVPCNTWFPMTQPPALSPTHIENFAYSQKSAMDILLEDKNKETQSLSDQENLEWGEQSDVSIGLDNTPVSNNMVCRGCMSMFKMMSLKSAINPYDRGQVTVNLINDLYRWRCIQCNEPGNALWDLVGSACARSLWSSLSCKYLHTASHITNHYHHTPPEILDTLRAKHHVAEQVYKVELQDALRFGKIPPYRGGMDFERFYLKHCYNIKNEFAFFLKMICSDICRVTCRVINNIYISEINVL